MKTLPGPHELITGDDNLTGQIRPVQVEDVLGREQVEVDLDAIAAYVTGRAVLVTGAGGSIGSELCRQLARLGARRLLLVEQAEDRRCDDIERELVDERRYPRPSRSSPTAATASKMREIFQSDEPARRLPRRRVQARADARVEPAPGGHEQRARDARHGAGRGRGRRRALRDDLDRQGREPEEPARPVEGDLRVDRRVVRPARRCRDALRRCSLRNVLGSSGLGDPDLPSSDRARRPGHGHATPR